MRRAGADRLRGAQVLGAQVVDALRARLPEQQIRRRAGRAVECQLQPLSSGEVDAVDVDVVVPEVDRRLHRLDSRRQLHRLRAGVVVRLVAVGRGQHAVERCDRLRHVEASPAAQRIAQERARLAPVRRVHVGR